MAVEPAVIRKKRNSAERARAAAAPAAASSPAQDLNAFCGDPNFMTSLARGLAVITAFSQQRRSQTIAQLSQATGLPRAAVRRCLYTLARLGYVGANERSFSLRPKILTLGHAYLASTPLAVSAQQYLDQVNAAVRESCSLAILDEDEIMYVARSTATTRIMSIDLKPGSRLPAYCSSIGRVLLAQLAPEELKAYFARTRLRAHTDRTIISREKLLQVLEAVRRQGYAMVDQELELGLRSIAVPVCDSRGRALAAMNVGVHAARVSVRELETHVLRHLRAAAGELGTLLST